MKGDNLIFVCALMDVFKTVDFHVLQPVRLQCVCVRYDVMCTILDQSFTRDLKGSWVV